MARNQVNREINSAKQACYKNAFSNCSGDQRKTIKENVKLHGVHLLEVLKTF